jgi:putative sterol carrier protein
VDGTSKAQWTVALKKGDVSVSRSSAKADCVVTTDRPLFNAIVRGERNAMAAILRGEIAVEGDRELLVLFQRVFAGPAESIQRREAVLAGRLS